VIDHHQSGDQLPEVDALINPNRPDDLSGLGHLAAVGLVLVTLVAVNRELRARGFWTSEMPEPDLLGMLHGVALGTRRRCRTTDRAQSRRSSPRA